MNSLIILSLIGAAAAIVPTANIGLWNRASWAAGFPSISNAYGPYLSNYGFEGVGSGFYPGLRGLPFAFNDAAIVPPFANVPFASKASAYFGANPFGIHRYAFNPSSGFAAGQEYFSAPYARQYAALSSPFNYVAAQRSIHVPLAPHVGAGQLGINSPVDYARLASVAAAYTTNAAENLHNYKYITSTNVPLIGGGQVADAGIAHYNPVVSSLLGLNTPSLYAKEVSTGFLPQYTTVATETIPVIKKIVPGVTTIFPKTTITV